MDLLATILTCSLYISDDALVRAIAESTPESNPYFVLDASLDLTQVDPPAPPKTAAQALERARSILVKGGRPVLGLLQIAPSWITAFGRQLEAAFEPCTNIAIGTAMLSAFDAECGRSVKGNSKAVAGPPHALRTPLRRGCVLRRYQEAIGLADFASVTRLELRFQHPAHDPELADAPIFRATTDTSATWASQLLIPIR